MSIRKITLLSLFIVIWFSASVPANAKGEKGLFMIQFGWNSESYPEGVKVSVDYIKKKGVKADLSTYPIFKNHFEAIELGDGEYVIKSINLTGGDIPYGKKISFEINKAFTISSGEVTNGGFFFLVKKNDEAGNVVFLHIDNEEDVKRYVSSYKPEFSRRLDNISNVWNPLDNSTVDKMATAYANLLVKRENRRSRPGVKYLYSTLGMFIEMEKDKTGKVLSHKLISSPTYQQITKVNIKKGKFYCRLGNEDYLYGDYKGLDFMDMPGNMKSAPSMYLLKNNQILMVDIGVNIAYTDESFVWSEQSEFEGNKAAALSFSIEPRIYYVPEHIYIYTQKGGATQRLIRSKYDDLNFESLSLSKEIKRIPLVTEIGDKVIIGPKTRISVKKPAYLYIQENGNITWQVSELPHGNCNTITVYEDDDDHIATTCLGDVVYETFNGGISWEKR